MPRKAGIPSLRRHRASGQGVVTLSRQDHYLGAWPNPEQPAPEAVVNAYNAAVAAWIARGRRRCTTSSGAAGDEGGDDYRIVELVVDYDRRSEEYYRHADGTPTGAADNVKLALKPLRELYEDRRVADFGPADLIALQEHLIAQKLSRAIINWRIGCVRRAFRWAVSRGRCAPEVLGRLLAVESLKKGRSRAVEHADIAPVPLADVMAVLPHLSWPVRHLVQVHLWGGMRTGEALRMRPCDLDRSGDVWIYNPFRHKGTHRGQERTVYLGPKAIAALLPVLPAVCPHCKRVGRRGLLDWSVAHGACGSCASKRKRPRNPPAELPLPLDWEKRPLFQPADAVAELRKRQRAARKSKVQPSQQDRSRKDARAVRPTYDRRSYKQCIERACAKAGVAKWVPLQLRHTDATLIRAKYGLEAARTILGHARVETTQIYAERDRDLARKIAREIG